MKPRVGISRCLLGDDVRYDGTNRRSSAVIALGAEVEWVPVCPEVEVGMGMPREPIQLLARADGVVLAPSFHRAASSWALDPTNWRWFTDTAPPGDPLAGQTFSYLKYQVLRPRPAGVGLEPQQQREHEGEDQGAADEHLRLEPVPVAGQVALVRAEERREGEDRQRTRRVLEPEVSVRDLPVDDRVSVALVNGRVANLAVPVEADVDHGPRGTEDGDREPGGDDRAARISRL